MPHIAVMLYPGHSDEIKQKAAEGIKNVVMQELGVSAEAVSVSFFDVPKEEFKEKVMAKIPDDKIVLGHK